MAKDTLTFALEGEWVDIRSYSEAIQHFAGLVEALSQEIGKGTAISWSLEALTTSSAIATIQGESEKPDVVEKVVRAYAVVGRSLERHEPIPYSAPVEREARALTRVLNGQIKSMRFETPEEDITISSQYGPSLEPRSFQAYGAIEGRVETLARRKGLRFYLYDSLHDKAVSCYVSEGQEQLMLGIWGLRVIVEGLVTRDPLMGHPTVIRQITNIKVLPEDSGDYYRARMVVPINENGISPEEAIRRVRDAE